MRASANQAHEPTGREHGARVRGVCDRRRVPKIYFWRRVTRGRALTARISSRVTVNRLTFSPTGGSDCNTRFPRPRPLVVRTRRVASHRRSSGCASMRTLHASRYAVRHIPHARLYVHALRGPVARASLPSRPMRLPLHPVALRTVSKTPCSRLHTPSSSASLYTEHLNRRRRHRRQTVVVVIRHGVQHFVVTAFDERRQAMQKPLRIISGKRTPCVDDVFNGRTHAFFFTLRLFETGLDVVVSDELCLRSRVAFGACFSSSCGDADDAHHTRSALR